MSIDGVEVVIWRESSVSGGSGAVQMFLRCQLLFYSSRRRHTRFDCDWSSDVCSSDLVGEVLFHRAGRFRRRAHQPEPGQARGAELQTAHGHPDELLRRDRVFRRGREGRGMTTMNSFGARAPLKAAGGTFDIFRLDALERRGLPVARLPYSLRILLENLLRREDGRTVTPAEIERLARWDPTKTPDQI